MPGVSWALHWASIRTSYWGCGWGHPVTEAQSTESEPALLALSVGVAHSHLSFPLPQGFWAWAVAASSQVDRHDSNGASYSDAIQIWLSFVLHT